MTKKQSASAKNIYAIRNHFGYNQTDFAEKVGVSQVTVSNWETSEHDVSRESIQKIMDAFSVSYDDVKSDDSGFAAKLNGRNGSGFVPVPLYGLVAAGTPIEMLPVDDTKEAPARYVDDDPSCYLVRVRGNSMNHHIQDGNYALVSPKYAEPNDRDMFLVTVNGDEATIKHVRKLANGVELIPDSYDPTYRTRIVDFNEEDAPPVKVLGKIVWWCKDF